MLIVPEADALDGRGQVPPQDIDQLHARPAGRPALLRLQPAHHARRSTAGAAASPPTSPRISSTGAPYYTVRIAVPDDEIAPARRPQARARHAGRGIHPDRRPHVMSYLVKPLTDQVMRAFRER